MTAVCAINLIDDAGAVGDGVTNDGAALQAALNSAAALSASLTSGNFSPRIPVLMPPRPYLIDRNIYVDTHRTYLKSNGAFLLYPTQSSGEAIRGYGGISDADMVYQGHLLAFKGFKIVGNPNINGIVFGQSSGYEAGQSVCHFSMENVGVDACKSGRRLESGAYDIQERAGWGFSNLYDFDIPAGYNDSFEHWTSFGGTFQGPRQSFINSAYANGELSFRGTSFVGLPPGSTLANMSAGVADLSCVHGEFGAITTPPILLSGDGTTFTWERGSLSTIDDPSVSTSTYLVNNTSSGGGVFIRKVKMLNIAQLYASTGSGVTEFKENIFNSNSAVSLMGNNLNPGCGLFPDWNWESAENDAFVIAASGVAGRYSGGSISWGISTIAPRYGAKNARVAKTGGPGAADQWIVAAPITPNRAVTGNVGVQLTGFAAGSLSIGIGFLALGGGSPYIVNKQSINYYSTVPYNTAPYVDRALNLLTPLISPEWATHVCLCLNFENLDAGSGTGYVDVDGVTQIWPW